MEDETQAKSHEGGKVRSYTLPFKITTIEYAEICGNRAAERYNHGRGRRSKQRKRCDCAGKNPLSEKLDDTVLEWVS